MDARLTCTRCAYDNFSQAHYCARCGLNLTAAGVRLSRQPARRQPRIVFAAVICFAIFAVGYLLMILRGHIGLFGPHASQVVKTVPDIADRENLFRPPEPLIAPVDVELDPVPTSTVTETHITIREDS